MGHTQKKLSSMLEAIGFRDVVLHPVQGYWRSDSRSQAYRWEGSGKSLLGLPVNFASYDTMTACVSAGIVSDKERGSFFEISAKEPVSCKCGRKVHRSRVGWAKPTCLVCLPPMHNPKPQIATAGRGRTT